MMIRSYWSDCLRAIEYVDTVSTVFRNNDDA